jgi:hypothetical protein
MTDTRLLQSNKIMRLIDAVIVLPQPDPESIIGALNIRMTRTPRPPNWEMAEGSFASGPFRSAELSYRTDLGSGMLLLRVHSDTALTDLDLDLDRFGPRPLPTPESSGPEGTLIYRYEFADGSKLIELSFGALLHRLQCVSLRWMPPGWTRPVPPGKERVWDGAPACVFLRSYDNVREVLEYAPVSRAWVLHPAGDVPEAQRTFGAFTREHDHVAGVFATPGGPAVFLDKTLMLARPGETSVRLEAEALSPNRSTFSMVYRNEFHQTHVLNSLIYEHRHGVGTNPYDTEREDVDLFALIANRLEQADFLRAYRRDWCVKPIASVAPPSLPFRPKQRRCSHCSGVAELSELSQQYTPSGSPLGMRRHYRCKQCGWTFSFESPGGNFLNVLGGLLFGVGGLLVLPAEPDGRDIFWSAVCFLIGAPLLWMAGSQLIQALRNPPIDEGG